MRAATNSTYEAYRSKKNAQHAHKITVWHGAPLTSAQTLDVHSATPERGKPLEWTPLRIIESQVQRLETEIDAMNEHLAPLDSFILPGGSDLAAHFHVARTLCRRAEREVAEVFAMEDEIVSPEALAYINRLSDWIFVAGRVANNNGADDVKWVPGANR